MIVYKTIYGYFLFKCMYLHTILRAYLSINLSLFLPYSYQTPHLMHATNETSSLCQMGAALGAEAMSHLEEVSEEGIEAMARAGTVGVLLPTTAHILRLPPPPARAMIDAGVPVALGTDFNPNAFCLSMVHCVRFVPYVCSYSLNSRLLHSLFVYIPHFLASLL